MLFGFTLEELPVPKFADDFFHANEYTVILFICVGSFVAFQMYQSKDETKSDDKKKEKSVTLRHPPEPSGGYPLVGHIPAMASHSMPHILMQEWWEELGDVYKIRLATRPAIVLNGYDTIREACGKKADDFSGRPDFLPWQLIHGGKSFAFGKYDARWKSHKKLVSKSLKIFTDEVLNENICQKIANDLAEEMLEKEGEPQVTHPMIHMATSKTMFKLIFGEDFEPSQDEAFFRFKDKVLEEFVNFVGPNNPINILPWTRHLLKKKCKTFHGFLKSIADFVQRQAKKHIDAYDENNLKDVLDVLIKTSQNLPEKSYGDEEIVTKMELYLTCTDFLEGGATSTIVFLNWAIIYSIRYPDIFEKVQEEIADVIGQKQPSQYDRPQMPYTEAVIMEIFRHSSFASGTLPHMTVNDTEIKGCFIPKDTLVLVNLHSITRDTRIWQDPEAFNPQRFLHEDGLINKKVAEYLPSFGIGRRRCVGEQIARLECFLFFTTLMKKCSFKAPKSGLKIEIATDVAIEPKPYQVVVQRRTE